MSHMNESEYSPLIKASEETDEFVEETNGIVNIEMITTELSEPEMFSRPAGGNSDVSVGSGRLTKLIGVATVIVYFNIAFCIALIGPTLLDLIQLTNVSWERMGVLLMERAACTVIGNMLAGCLANLNVVYLLAVQAGAHLAVLVSQILLPICRTQVELIILFTIQGIFLGANNGLSNLLTVVVQGSSAHAWMQGLFMAYSSAVLLAPIVATPFLSEEAAKNQSSQSCNATVPVTLDPTTLLHNIDDIDLRIPYWTSAIPCSIAICLLVLAAVWARVSKFAVPDVQETGPEKRLKPGFIILSFFLALLYFTLDGVTGRFLFSFAVKSKLCLSVKVAGMITTLYGGATCIMRGSCAVVAALKPNLANPVRLLVANHVALSIALVTILLGRDSYIPAVWIFAFFSGIGVSNGFPSLMALLKSMGATKKVISVLPIGGGIGITIGPLITTYLMKDDVAGPGQGFYALFCITAHLATLLFGALMSTTDRGQAKPRPIRQKNVSVSYNKDGVINSGDGVIINETVGEEFEEAVKT